MNPDILDIVDPILGEAYEHYNCSALIRYLFREGFGLHIDQDPRLSGHLLTEVWWRDDDADPVELSRPWDLWIFAMRPPRLITDHVGIVVNHELFVHTRQRTGVCLERLSRYDPWVVQVGRLSRSGLC